MADVDGQKADAAQAVDDRQRGVPARLGATPPDGQSAPSRVPRLVWPSAAVIAGVLIVVLVAVVLSLDQPQTGGGTRSSRSMTLAGTRLAPFIHEV